MSGPQDGLSIGELARRTGVPPATLRSWEDRYAFPRPQRPGGGHRRYEQSDVALIGEVLGLRASGMSLHAAISQAAARAAETGPSLFADLRRRHPGLMPQELRKATLLALTRAIEDECCARAEQAVLFAGFQQEHFYRHSEERWKELARTARVVVIFAGFGQPSAPGTSPLAVRLPDDAPLRREWFLVCAAPDHAALVSAWEFPGQKGIPDARRRFEVLWSVDPPAVRDAAVICAGLARSLSPGLDRLLGDLPPGSPPPASADLRRAVGLFNRMASYLDKREHRQPAPDRWRTVDEAWGAHLPFHPDLPTQAMAAGADVCVVSVHKMGTGLEPGSVFHQQDGLVDPDQLSACADMLMTASPNVMIYAALDGWRRQMAEHGQDLLDAADWRRERQRLGMGLSDHRRIEATLSIELPDYLRSGPSPDAIRVVSPH